MCVKNIFCLSFICRAYLNMPEMFTDRQQLYKRGLIQKCVLSRLQYKKIKYENPVMSVVVCFVTCVTQCTVLCVDSCSLSCRTLINHSILKQLRACMHKATSLYFG
jgi:hypothetical protein